ncbi:unnamed protein product [Hydatigera taeniaeformis]|uniref:Transmembrane protein n=1 Tax=Hydatigena taeniaeformis TaxID=6205 RepID=A0A0R3X925_HYDTA|nr:unnamed protein product [Hydatigera taeniaeformis]
MIIHSVLVGIGFGMLFNVFDKYNPRTVLTSIFLLVLNCWVLLTQLGVVGVNLDLEQKQADKRGPSLWMSEADQSSFSWSFGLAAFVLLFVLVALNILVWCVYPRKHAALEESRRAESLSEQQRIELTRLHRTADPSRDTDLSSLDVGTYDPRSADAMTEGNQSEDNHISSFKMSAAGMKLEEGELYDRRTAVFQSDPRTAVDENLSRVSSRMSSVRSSNGVSGAFDRERNRTYIIKKGQSHITPQTVVSVHFLLEKLSCVR